MRSFFPLALLLAAFPLLAQENFVNNPYTPYPPACVTSLDLENDDAYGERELISAGTIRLVNPFAPTKSTVGVEIYRQGCSESGRSAILIQLEVLNGGGTFVPLAFLVVDQTGYDMRLVGEPNSSYVTSTGSLIFPGEPNFFVLDGPAPADVQNILDNDGTLVDPDVYNGAFTLIMRDVIDFIDWNIPIEAYDGGLDSGRIPLNGRMSGNWVVAGVPDQGFVLAFEELPDGTSFLFLSWYTYDSDGELLWITAGDTYEIGDDSIELDLELVTGGSFLGQDAANREVVGSGTLSGIHCNNLQWQFNLTQLGLGAATVQLQRLFSLEPAGYTCRDQWEREDTIND